MGYQEFHDMCHNDTFSEAFCNAYCAAEWSQYHLDLPTYCAMSV
jgi:hypothetical protein